MRLTCTVNLRRREEDDGKTDLLLSFVIFKEGSGAGISEEGMTFGSVFAPMIAIWIADFFILKRDVSGENVYMRNLVIWVIGFACYRMLMRVDMITGNTLPDMVEKRQGIEKSDCLQVHFLIY